MTEVAVMQVAVMQVAAPGTALPKIVAPTFFFVPAQKTGGRGGFIP
jgi:hypothetical protein